jgi:hypothetical protein
VVPPSSFVFLPAYRGHHHISSSGFLFGNPLVCVGHD